MRARDNEEDKNHSSRNDGFVELEIVPHEPMSKPGKIKGVPPQISEEVLRRILGGKNSEGLNLPN